MSWSTFGWVVKAQLRRPRIFLTILLRLHRVSSIIHTPAPLLRLLKCHVQQGHLTIFLLHSQSRHEVFHLRHSHLQVHRKYWSPKTSPTGSSCASRTTISPTMNKLPNELLFTIVDHRNTPDRFALYTTSRLLRCRPDSMISNTLIGSGI